MVHRATGLPRCRVVEDDHQDKTAQGPTRANRRSPAPTESIRLTAGDDRPWGSCAGGNTNTRDPPDQVDDDHHTPEGALMGTVFKKQTTRAVPAGAEVTEKSGSRVARWRVRGKVRTARVTVGGGGSDRIVTESATYFAKFRDAGGAAVTRPTGCRDRQAAEQMLKKWEREVEQIKAGTLDQKSLDAARMAAVPLENHVAEYEVSLRAAEVSDVYRANTLRAVRRVAKECGFGTVAAINREAVDRWLVAQMGGPDKMGPHTRNYYRGSVIAFANWCVQTRRLLGHDLNRVARADPRTDPRRQRRALTADELTRVLAVAAARPLADARTVRRGKRKGQAVATLKPDAEVRLLALGGERALIYKTLVLTGLRRNELATLTVGQLDLTAGSAFLKLDAADEKSREGNCVAIRDDLAADLRAWLAEKLLAAQAAARAAGRPVPARLPADTPLFVVPTGLVRILDRDLRAAGIPKRDDRGRTVDVHALRTTFGTMLSATGTAPRTAQAAMRHSDIKLTMGVYTDTRMLGVREAVEKLPALPLPAPAVPARAAARGYESATGPADSVAPPVAPTGCLPGHFPSSGGNEASTGESRSGNRGGGEKPGNVNETPPVTSGVTGGRGVERRRFELLTSSLRTKRSTN
jgi:integrase